MALQDLTPQLRVRLSRMERAVGWFILLATALLLFGFGYYIYNTAQSKGWLKKKVYYQTSIRSGAGLKVGDPVKLMGFNVGEITAIVPNKPYEWYNVTVNFRIREPDFGYVWTDSKVKIVAGDFLGGRYLEVTKGVYGMPTVLTTTNEVPLPLGLLNRNYFNQRRTELAKQLTNEVDLIAALKADSEKNREKAYTNYASKPGYWLEPEEAVALTERAEQLVSKVEAALPGILELTNKINAVLDNSSKLTSNLNVVAEGFRPAATNLVEITAQWRTGKGAFGEWLIPTNINEQLEATLRSANKTLIDADTNIVALAESLGQSLENLANLTSNLNNQVQTNSNILTEISDIVVHSDQLVQGLKRHWLLRSAFKGTNAPPAAPKQQQPVTSPKSK